MPSGEQLVPLLTTLVCHSPGSNPVPPDLGADTLPTELPRPVWLEITLFSPKSCYMYFFSKFTLLFPKFIGTKNFPKRPEKALNNNRSLMLVLKVIVSALVNVQNAVHRNFYYFISNICLMNLKFSLKRLTASFIGCIFTQSQIQELTNNSKIVKKTVKVKLKFKTSVRYEPHREKTGSLPM